jgi:hypothetical protein
MNTNLKNSRGTLAVMIALASIVSSQCSKASTSPTSPGAVAAGAGSTSVLGGPSSSTPTLTEIRVCRSAASNVGGNVVIEIVSSNSGVGSVSSPIAVLPNECFTAAIDTGLAGVGSFIRITDQAPGLVSSSLMRNDAGSQTGPYAFPNASTLFLNSFHGHTVTFENQIVVNTGDQGCTPGYWKQPQHLDSWVGYSTGADFDATFGVNFFSPDLTLLQALWQGGGGAAALGRHAVAALLNTANAGVAYPYTTAQVLDIVQGDGAYLGLNLTQRKILLEAANELGCPLN